MKNISKYLLVLFLYFGITLNSCKKQDDFLNVKQNISQVRPETLDDFQAILDNYDMINYHFPLDGLAGVDNFVVPDAKLSTLPAITRNLYLWQKDIFQGASSASWSFAYGVIEYTNIVLDGLEKVTISNPSEQIDYNNIKGQALFFRSIAFYMLSQDFCKPYESVSANTDLGIVLRLSSDINIKSTRSSVAQTYQQMISDLQTAANLLPITPLYQMRPSRPAANALLAKIYLSMGDYKNAADYATKSLNDFSILLDFNNKSLVNATNAAPFPNYPHNPEICFYAYENGNASSLFFTTLTYSNVDTSLLNSYQANDLRKNCFYKLRTDGSYGFKGTYAAYYPFAGVATNEVYLIRAESRARIGDTNGALSDLNTLLLKRYVTGTYVPVTINDQTKLLKTILSERRKELPFTGQLRWEDLRRLNQDSNFAVTLTRVYQGTTYTLPPNDPRYVLPIPDNEIQLSGIQQNPR